MPVLGTNGNTSWMGWQSVFPREHLQTETHPDTHFHLSPFQLLVFILFTLGDEWRPETPEETCMVASSGSNQGPWTCKAVMLVTAPPWHPPQACWVILFNAVVHSFPFVVGLSSINQSSGYTLSWLFILHQTCTILRLNPGTLLKNERIHLTLLWFRAVNVASCSELMHSKCCCLLGYLVNTTSVKGNCE